MRLARFLIALSLMLCLAGLARAQTEFVLTPEGEWEVSDAPEPGSDAATIAEAARLIAAGEAKEARRILDRWIKDNAYRPAPLLPRAYLLRGHAKELLDREYKALRDYETIATEFPGSEEFVPALQRELEIARSYLGGLKKRSFLFGARITSGVRDAEEIIIRINSRLPTSNLAAEALMDLARYYMRTADYGLAAIIYEYLLRSGGFTWSPQRRAAMKELIDSQRGRFKGPEYDPSGLVEAKAVIEEYAQSFPSEAADIAPAMIARIDESTAAHDLSVAKWYIRRGDEVGARFRLGRLIEMYPETVSAVRAQEIMDARGWKPIRPLKMAEPEMAPQQGPPHGPPQEPEGSSPEAPAGEPTPAGEGEL